MGEFVDKLGKLRYFKYHNLRQERLKQEEESPAVELTNNQKLDLYK